MAVENRKEGVPFAYYADKFRQSDPKEVCRRLKGLRWNGKEFYVNLLNRKFAISHPDYALRPLDGGALPTMAVQTFLLRYLLESRDLPASGSWKTFREMPWGEVYWKSFSGRILARAAYSFGARTATFREAAEAMGAVTVHQGDAGYQFSFLPGYEIRMLIWEADEEFPPNAQILYSDNWAAAFTAEDRVVAAEILIAAIKETM